MRGLAQARGVVLPSGTMPGTIEGKRALLAGHPQSERGAQGYVMGRGK